LINSARRITQREHSFYTLKPLLSVSLTSISSSDVDILSLESFRFAYTPGQSKTQPLPFRYSHFFASQRFSLVSLSVSFISSRQSVHNSSFSHAQHFLLFHFGGVASSNFTSSSSRYQIALPLLPRYTTALLSTLSSIRLATSSSSLPIFIHSSVEFVFFPNLLPHLGLPSLSTFPCFPVYYCLVCLQSLSCMFDFTSRSVSRVSVFSIFLSSFVARFISFFFPT